MESAVHQIASASIAAIFSVSMLCAAHLFSEHRSSRMQAFAAIQLPARAFPARLKPPFEANIGEALAQNRGPGAI